MDLVVFFKDIQDDLFKHLETTDLVKLVCTSKEVYKTVSRAIKRRRYAKVLIMAHTRIAPIPFIHPIQVIDEVKRDQGMSTAIQSIQYTDHPCACEESCTPIIQNVLPLILAQHNNLTADLAELTFLSDEERTAWQTDITGLQGHTMLMILLHLCTKVAILEVHNQSSTLANRLQAAAQTMRSIHGMDWRIEDLGSAPFPSIQTLFIDNSLGGETTLNFDVLSYPTLTNVHLKGFTITGATEDASVSSSDKVTSPAKYICVSGVSAVPQPKDLFAFIQHFPDLTMLQYYCDDHEHIGGLFEGKCGCLLDTRKFEEGMLKLGFEGYASQHDLCLDWFLDGTYRWAEGSSGTLVLVICKTALKGTAANTDI